MCSSDLIAYPCEISQVLDAWEAEHEAIAKLPQEVTDEEYSPAYAQGYRVAIQTVMGVLNPEPVSETDPKLSECKHWTSITQPERQGFNETIKFTYCPKCGEKL